MRSCEGPVMTPAIPSRETPMKIRDSERFPSWGARCLLALIYFYRRWFSAVLPAACRFEPTCSAYASEAVTRHGALRGSALAVRRIGRCHPRHPGGLDPVPSVQEEGGTR